MDSAMQRIIWFRTEKELAAICRLPQNVRTAQKGPYVRKKGSDGVAKRERRHSEFSLDALVVVEVDIAVNHGVGFA